MFYRLPKVEIPNGCGMSPEPAPSDPGREENLPGTLAAARARRVRGESPAKIAEALGVSRASIYRHLAAESE